MKSTVQAQFGRQAAAYARSLSHAGERDLALLVGHLALQPEDRVLDIATGTGFTAFALAEVARHVVGLDLTIGMLREARHLAPHTRVQWIVGDAEALPFGAGMFDAVTVRRAPHHFSRIETALTEMLRVLRPGGRLGIVDQAPPEEEAGRDLMEQLERLRDPSHVGSLRASRWQQLLAAYGVAISFVDIVERRHSIDAWLLTAGPDPARRQMIEETLRQASPAARRQIGDPGSEPISFLKRWVVLVGTKASRR